MTLRAISAIESHRLARCLLSKQLRFSWIKFHRAKCQLNLVSVTMSDKTSNLRPVYFKKMLGKALFCS